MSNKGWIGVDLDGTLAHYTSWKGPTHIGAPIDPMVRRVQRWLAGGMDVKIFTARVSTPDLNERQIIVKAIEDWCRHHVGAKLPITCSKDFAMVELWDDRCVQVEPNTGIPISSAVRALEASQG